MLPLSVSMKYQAVLAFSDVQLNFVSEKSARSYQVSIRTAGACSATYAFWTEVSGTSARGSKHSPVVVSWFQEAGKVKRTQQ
jgi:hypothetical protein